MGQKRNEWRQSVTKKDLSALYVKYDLSLHGSFIDTEVHFSHAHGIESWQLIM